jgi:hypothetical protein
VHQHGAGDSGGGNQPFATARRKSPKGGQTELFFPISFRFFWIMKYSNLLVALSATAIPLSQALPTKRDDVPELDVLNVALSLEHLEGAFYKQGLDKYSAQAFEDAGYPSVRGRYEQMLKHENTHVGFLQKVLKEKAVKPCEYSFPDTDVKSFLRISAMLETIGASAYTGAAHLLHTPEFLTAAASILSTESRQSTFISSSVLHLNPWSTSFEAPLDLNQAFTLASPLIKSCPPDNTPLPVKAFAALTIPETTLPGQTVSVQFSSTSDTANLHAAFISGFDTLFVPLKSDNGKFSVDVPSQLIGVVYVVITSDPQKLDDSTTIAGPALLNFAFDDQEKLIHPSA